MESFFPQTASFEYCFRPVVPFIQLEISLQDLLSNSNRLRNQIDRRALGLDSLHEAISILTEKPFPDQGGGKKGFGSLKGHDFEFLSDLYSDYNVCPPCVTPRSGIEEKTSEEFWEIQRGSDVYCMTPEPMQPTIQGGGAAEREIEGARGQPKQRERPEVMSELGRVREQWRPQKECEEIATTRSSLNPPTFLQAAASAPQAPLRPSESSLAAQKVPLAGSSHTPSDSLVSDAVHRTGLPPTPALAPLPSKEHTGSVKGGQAEERVSSEAEGSFTAHKQKKPERGEAESSLTANGPEKAAQGEAAGFTANEQKKTELGESEGSLAHGQNEAVLGTGDSQERLRASPGLRANSKLRSELQHVASPAILLQAEERPLPSAQLSSSSPQPSANPTPSDSSHTPAQGHPQPFQTALSSPPSLPKALEATLEHSSNTPTLHTSKHKAGTRLVPKFRASTGSQSLVNSPKPSVADLQRGVTKGETDDFSLGTNPGSMKIARRTAYIGSDVGGQGLSGSNAGAWARSERGAHLSTRNSGEALALGRFALEVVPAKRPKRAKKTKKPPAVKLVLPPLNLNGPDDLAGAYGFIPKKKSASLVPGKGGSKSRKKE